MPKNDPVLTVKVRPLVELAIGYLGDLSGDITMFRRLLHRLKTKEEWTPAQMDKFKSSLKKMAEACDTDLDTWERESNVKLP